MFDVNVGGGPFLTERRPCYPRRSHSRFFLGFYLCLLLPEIGSKSEIETVKAAAPDSLVEQIEEAEKTPPVVTQAMLDASKGVRLSDDDIVDLIGDSAPSPQPMKSCSSIGKSNVIFSLRQLAKARVS